MCREKKMNIRNVGFFRYTDSKTLHLFALGYVKIILKYKIWPFWDTVLQICGNAEIPISGYFQSSLLTF